MLLLQIPTKIVKGQIEITNVVALVARGEKVGPSQCALLDKLDIRPFSYGLKINEIFDDGNFFAPAVLDIDDAYLAAKFAQATKQVAALSFALNYPTQASIPHAIGNAFKSLVAVTVGLEGYSFEAADPYKAAL